MKGAKVCVPAKAGWGYKAERASLVAVIDAIKSQSKKASAVKQQAQQQARRWRSGREHGDCLDHGDVHCGHARRHMGALQ